MFIKISLFNIWKYRKRTLLVVFIILVSVFFMCLFSGMFDGMAKGFYDNMLLESGHIQIHQKGYKDSVDSLSLDFLMDNVDTMINDTSQISGIIHVEKTINFGAILLKDDKNLTISGHGIHQDTPFYDNAKKNIIEGDFIENNQTIVVSSEVCDLLDAKLGDYIFVMVQDKNHSAWFQDYKIGGIFKSQSSQFDTWNFFISHQAAEELLDASGYTSEIKILMKDIKEAIAIAKELQIKLGPMFEVEDWKQIHGSLVIFIKLFDLYVIFFNLLVIIVSASVITNAILMIQFDKVREFGTLRAIGLKKRQLFGLVVTEGIIEGLVGASLGVMLAVPLILYFQTNGLNIGEMMESFGLGSSLNFSLEWDSMMVNFISGILVAFGGSLYAARVSSKRSIINSLHFV